MDRESFEMLLMWMRIFYTDKKGAFSKISRYVWTGPQSSSIDIFLAQCVVLTMNLHSV